jgi:basic amino acid/polyamine antiporter, APA family
VSAPPSPALDRQLGPYDAAAIVVSNVIGSGIFFVPILVAALVPDAWAILLVWTIGGALAFAGAMAYAELAALRPHAGGEYVYLRDAYGRRSSPASPARSPRARSPWPITPAASCRRPPTRRRY